MTFYIVYGLGILIALIMAHSLFKRNRELEAKNRAARELEEREEFAADNQDSEQKRGFR
jgi:hypothetical protein